MVQRRRVAATPPGQGGGLYFPSLSGVKCIPTGCTLLDCVLGGGWARGRIANIVGDKALGKSLLAIEACANFALQEPRGKIFYREAEAAFDIPYAQALGLPVNRVDFGEEGIDTQWDTIEDIFEDLEKQLEVLEAKKVPGLYIIDSLDAVGSRADLERKIDQGSYAMEKQKLLGVLFKRLVRKFKTVDLTLLIISQVRENIGVTFGEKHRRSGGKSLDFYASQVLWLSNLGLETKTVKGVKRPVAQRIKAKCKKNKVSLPFRDCEFTLTFGYGVEDAMASLDFLEEVKKLSEFLGTTKREAYEVALDAATGELRKEMQGRLTEAVRAAWQEVEQRFAPTKRKYG